MRRLVVGSGKASKHGVEQRMKREVRVSVLLWSNGQSKTKATSLLSRHQELDDGRMTRTTHLSKNAPQTSKEGLQTLIRPEPAAIQTIQTIREGGTGPPALLRKRRRVRAVDLFQRRRPQTTHMNLSQGEPKCPTPWGMLGS